MDDYTRDSCTASASRKQEEQRAVCVGAVVCKIFDDSLSEEGEMLAIEPVISVLA